MQPVPLKILQAELRRLEAEAEEGGAPGGGPSQPKPSDSKAGSVPAVPKLQVSCAATAPTPPRALAAPLPCRAPPSMQHPLRLPTTSAHYA